MSVHDWSNIVLIGMPGVGKSTVGVILAKVTQRQFVDTDVLMQARTGRSLQEILDREGLEEFCRIEERVVLELSCRLHVIATGGSVVYSDAAMGHLSREAVIVHLDLPLAELTKRVGDMRARGVVAPPGETLADLFAERQPLYRRFADVAIDCSGLNHEAVVAWILESI